MSYLPEIDLITVQSKKTQDNSMQFVIEPLLPGYGVTLGNTFRRVLLSSLKGSAITAVKINDKTHEFTTVEGVDDDIVNIILNLKGLKIAYEGEEPATIKLNIKGPAVVTGKDFATPAGLEIANPDHIIAKIANKASLLIEARVEVGKGYLPIEAQSDENIPVDMIAIDAIFTPIKKINYEVSNTRVGQITNYDKLILDISTDGTIDPVSAFETANQIITEHIGLIATQIKPAVKKTVSKPSKKKATK